MDVPLQVAVRMQSNTTSSEKTCLAGTVKVLADKAGRLIGGDVVHLYIYMDKGSCSFDRQCKSFNIEIFFK